MVYVDSDNEVEFDLPADEQNTTIVDIISTDPSDDDEDNEQSFHQVQQWNMDCFESQVVRSAQHFPKALASIPRCLSPPLQSLVPSLTGKQDYHDAVAAKLGVPPRPASPLDTAPPQDQTPSPPKRACLYPLRQGIQHAVRPPPPPGVQPLSSANLGHLLSGNTRAPKSSARVTSVGQVQVPTYLQNTRTKPTVVNREMLAGIPNVVHMLRDNQQGISISIPQSHSRRLGELLTQKSLLPARRSPIQSYNIHPRIPLPVQVFAPGFNRTMRIFRLNPECIRDLILDNFYILRDSSSEQYYLVMTTSDLKIIMEES